MLPCDRDSFPGSVVGGAPSNGPSAMREKHGMAGGFRPIEISPDRPFPASRTERRVTRLRRRWTSLVSFPHRVPGSRRCVFQVGVDLMSRSVLARTRSRVKIGKFAFDYRNSAAQSSRIAPSSLSGDHRRRESARGVFVRTGPVSRHQRRARTVAIAAAGRRRLRGDRAARIPPWSRPRCERMTSRIAYLPMAVKGTCRENAQTDATLARIDGVGGRPAGCPSLLRPRSCLRSRSGCSRDTWTWGSSSSRGSSGIRRGIIAPRGISPGASRWPMRLSC